MQIIRQRLSLLSIQAKKKVLSFYIYSLIIIALIVISVFYFSVQPSYENIQYTKFIQQYSKKYSPLQETYRRFIFYQTYNDIIFHNKNQLDSSYVKGINEFSDLTKQQFQQLYHMVTLIATTKNYIQIADFQFDTYDWSEKYLPPTIKNMKGYDVGHVFATVQILQFWVNRKRKENQPWITLSPQQILDCCQNCGLGQQLSRVLKYVIQNGISTDTNYPYVNAIYNPTKQECKTKNITKPYKPIVNYARIKNCKQLSNAIQVSPVIVGIDARQLKDYSTGIVDNCGTKKTHYLLLVGKGLGYWKLRNNWGLRWGQQGYVRLKLANTCSVCLYGYSVTFSQSS